MKEWTRALRDGPWAAAVAGALVVGTVTAAAIVLAGGEARLAIVGSIAAAATGAAVARWRAPAPARERRDTRWTALISSASPNARETLAAVERLTDPLAVEHRVTQAMRELAPEARLELLRAADAPGGIMAGAREADPQLLQQAVQHGVLRAAKSRGSFVGDLLLPVRYGGQVYGALAVRGPVRGTTLVHLQRFSDLLAFKLELHRAYGELAHREQLAALGTFASSLAHDLRTPLSSIRMALQQLESYREAMGEDAELLDIARQEVDRLVAFVGEVLDYSRPVELEPGAVAVHELVADVVRRQNAAAKAAGVGLRSEVARDLPRLRGDRRRLERALDNLVSNAIAVAPKGSDVRVRVSREDDATRIDVVDRGPGIAKADLPRLFEPFFTRRRGGTGLGLSIVRRIVDAHGGRIDIDTAVGRGTRMSIVLPDARRVADVRSA